MAKIRDTQTGQIIEVPDNELSKYGLSAPTVTPEQTVAPATQPTTTTNSQYLTGRSPEEHYAALQRARAANNKEAIKAIEADMNLEIKEQEKRKKADPKSIELKGAPATDVNLLKGILSTSAAAAEKYDPKYTGFIDALKGKARTTFGTKGSSKETEFRSDIADIRTAVRQYISGAAIPKSEAKEFEDLIPKVSDSDEKIRGKMKALQERSIRKTENVLSTAGHTNISGKEYLGTDVKELPQNPNEQIETGNGVYDTIKNNKVLNFLLGTSADVSKDIGSGAALKMDGDTINQTNQSLQDSISKWYAMAEKAKDPATKKKYIQQAQNISAQIQSGSELRDENFSQGVEDNPFARGLGAASEIVGAGEAPALIKGGFNMLNKVAPTIAGKFAPKAATEATEGVVENAPGILTKVKNTVDDLTLGGGSDKYMLNRAGKNLTPRNQVLREEGINTATNLSRKSRAEAAGVALNRIGSKLDEAYKSSEEVITNTDISNTLTKSLLDKGYTQKAIDVFKKTLSKDEYWDISGDYKLTPKQYWENIKKIQKLPPSAKGNPELTKELKIMSQDATRLLREDLAERVGTKDLNHRYNTVRDFADEGLAKKNLLPWLVGGTGGVVAPVATYSLVDYLKNR